jgi:hypothetical protein
MPGLNFCSIRSICFYYEISLANIHNEGNNACSMLMFPALLLAIVQMHIHLREWDVEAFFGEGLIYLLVHIKEQAPEI